MSITTWLLVFGCLFLTGIFVLFGLDAADAGLFPGNIDPAAMILAFFLHDNPVHLLANCYFLLVFGILSEAEDGWQSVLAQLGTGAVLAFVADTILRHNSDMPSIGASGALAALVAGFTLRHTSGQLVWRLPSVLKHRELRLPVLLVAGIWAAIEILDLVAGFESLHQPTQIAGVLGGIAWELGWRFRFFR